MRLSPEFKPLCWKIQLDISRYGWQKWQDRGKKWQRGGNEVARSVAKTAMFGWMAAIFTLPGVGMHVDEVSIFASL